MLLVSVSKSVFLPNSSFGSLCSHLQIGKGKTELRYSDFPGCISIPVRCVNILPLSLQRDSFRVVGMAYRTASNPPWLLPRDNQEDLQREPFQL